MNKLQKISILILAVILLYWGFISSIKPKFEIVEPVHIHFVKSPQASRVWAEEDFIDLQLYTWDLTNSQPNEINTVISFLKSVIEETERPLILNLQGLRFEQINRVKALLTKTGGCWAYAPLWRSPNWLFWLQKFDVDIYHLLWGEVLTEESYEHGIWTGMVGSCEQLKLSAERWALPARPGRWPKRILHRKPAILALNINYLHLANKTQVEYKDDHFQVLNIKLADTRHKHQAGALALQSLKKSPLSGRFKEPWVILGDWRVNPPYSKSHQEVSYRFQRFSLDTLSQSYVPLFKEKSDPQLWGRWRLGNDELSEPSVIDLAYASEGRLSASNLDGMSLPWIGKAHQQIDLESSSTQISHGEQRAPLKVEWHIEKKQ